MEIRKLRQSDIGKIVAMIHDVMGPDDAKKALEDMKISLDTKAKVPYKFEEFYVVDIDGEVAAAGGFWSLKYDPNIARLDWFVVPHKHQRKGFGSMLINFIINRSKERKVRLLMAETSAGIPTAVNFLKKSGFREIARFPGYWDDGAAGIYLTEGAAY
jgi:ribosomal protein S18 acetylase RimI-like enzyme